MRLDRFCKVVGVFMLLTITLPVWWMLLTAIALGATITDFERQLGTSVPIAPTVSVINGIMVSIILIGAILSLGFPVNLFFKRNWLRWLVLWLSPDGKKLVMTELVIRMDDQPGQSSPSPIKPTEPPAPEPEKKYRHPDEPYLPPQYRQSK